MPGNPSLQDLWDSVRPTTQVFDPGDFTTLPVGARRYLGHAIEPGTPLASAVRLTMSGEIKLKKWVSFEAEQVINWDRGFLWRATAWMGAARIEGFDSLIDGHAQMRWRLFGLIPVMSADGPDIDKSAVGRLAAESVWLPSALCRDGVRWAAENPTDVRVAPTDASESPDLRLALDADGRLESVSLRRWGELAREKGYSYRDFGGLAEQEESFEGYTIPTRMRVGWHFGSDRFAREGEFFRCHIQSAEFR